MAGRLSFEILFTINNSLKQIFQVLYNTFWYYRNVRQANLLQFAILIRTCMTLSTYGHGDKQYNSLRLLYSEIYI